QKGLGRETASLKEKLKGAAVFELMLETTAKGMRQAATKMIARKEAARKPPPGGVLEKDQLAAEGKVQAQTVRLQQEASRRLQRLIDALKPDAGVAMRPKKQEGKDGEKEGEKRPKGGI